MKNHTMKLAFSGMLVALSTALMFLTNLFPVASYTLPAIAGALWILSVIELGKGWAWPSFVASSLLSFLVVADKEAVAMFVLFFGYYPIQKAYFEQFSRRFLTWLAKYLLFNVAMIVEFILSIHLLGVPEESFTVFGVYLPWVFLLIGNVAFLLYDYCLSCLVVVYCQRMHKNVQRWLHLK